MTDLYVTLEFTSPKYAQRFAADGERLLRVLGYEAKVVPNRGPLPEDLHIVPTVWNPES